MIQLLLAVIYLSFISLGLPDALLGSAWPVMYPAFSVPVSYAGLVSTIITLGTIVSSLMSDRLTHRFGAGKVTAFSVALTALALMGFSCSGSFFPLLLWAIPYGLGAGGVDAALNNYVALHYSSRHMSWLHCMWGLGASVGPYIMSYALTNTSGWPMGYRFVGLIQIILTIILFLSLPLWKGGASSQETAAETKPLTIPEILNIPGAKAVFITFFCYCALESTAGLWASSFLVLHKGMDEETAASFASMFYLGITLGRFINGFLTMKLEDHTLIRLGQGIIFMGIIVVLLPLEPYITVAGLVLIGLGCAPIYPCIIHSTPSTFGEDKSQAMIGVQMASAYLGSCLMPPLFGLIANHISVSLFPGYLFIINTLMFIMHQRLCKITST